MVDPRTIPVRFSNLKKMARSPAHYLAAISAPSGDSPAMRMGRLVHALVLGGLEQFAVYEGERRGKVWLEFQAAHAGLDIVTASEHDKAQRVADAVHAEPLAVELLEGDHEVKVPWRNMGRECHSTIDVLGSQWVTELKTSSVTSPGWFSHQSLRMLYHAQLAWYLDAARSIGRKADCGYIVAVETAPPYAVTTFELTTRAAEEGRKLCRLWLEKLLVCEASNAWPAYAQTTLELDVPDREDVTLLIEGEEVAA